MGMRDLPYRLSDISHKIPYADEEDLEIFNQEEAAFEKLKNISDMSS